MSFDLEARRARLEPLLESARTLADPNTERGARARQRIAASSGLSTQGVDLALAHCLECTPSERDVERLLRSTPSAEVAHVLLSANVFVAAHRAIAIGLAASERVCVRPSRRESEMAALLLEGAPGAFRLVGELSAQAGDRVWAYGTDRTLEEVAVTLPPGVAFHGHGTGFGVAVMSGRATDAQLEQTAAGVALDTALFDQRGCLSPRVLLVESESESAPGLALELAQAVARELAEFEARVPRGVLDQQELAAIAAYRDTVSYAGDLLEAGLGFVSLANGGAWLLPPVGRNLHVVATEDALATLVPIRPMITSCAFSGEPSRRRALQAALPGARLCDFGSMQSPPFDGPVDRRES